MNCLTCGNNVSTKEHHQHMANHQAVRLHSSKEYIEQIMKDMADGIEPAKDERAKPS